MLEIDNLRVEKNGTIGDITMWQVRNIDTDEVLFLTESMSDAIDYATSPSA
jgi:hypothetical protein